ncbi:MAG: hypothetical protein LLF86_04590 [Nitrospiraceae bacterium]|nr:hypothetical protein [Nitrospiraceae bacterium]
MFQNVLSFNEIKNEQFVKENIRWDLAPADCMKPAFGNPDSCKSTYSQRKGYVFYIDTLGDKPGLFLMRQTSAGYAETLARVDEIPDELLIAAVEQGSGKAAFGMLPITKEIEDWLKKELG